MDNENNKVYEQVVNYLKGSQKILKAENKKIYLNEQEKIVIENSEVANVFEDDLESIQELQNLLPEPFLKEAKLFYFFRKSRYEKNEENS